jgi:eukaryotic-like serine/threonine-protein kinase
VPSPLCPKCLLKAGFETEPSAGPEGTVRLPAPEARLRGLPLPGDHFGHYQIVRLLGQGGMGAAFEAEDLESGRRVALKVLSQSLDSPEARARFLREGRLAASINHPNSVYVFGTEEIGGTPVISMELVPGGTLQDRVRVHGPLPISEAVDSILEIIAGLEAAQRIGILHRDVKPSNCFLAEDGTVKIGDFGLSISTTVRGEPALTGTGGFLGTPAYCSPEQLRGEELNARSDMYSVGVTLYFLLTGRTPFDAPNTVQLLANVLEKRAPSPREFRKAIPEGLAGAVLRCLEKQSGDRFKSYDELRLALARYSSTAPTPATLGLRFLAGALDMMLLGLLGGAATLAWFGDPMEMLNLQGPRSAEALGWMLGGFFVMVLYYAISEGRWGATVGKAVCRLRVTSLDHSPPGVPRALARALLFVLLPVLPFWIASRGDPFAYLHYSGAVQYLMQFSFYLVLALLFSTVRRRNGFAAVHDLITKTRVISRAALQPRSMLSPVENPPPAVEARPRIGPYHVLETLGKSGGAEWVLGYDLRLLRKVWLRVVPSGTPPVPATCRSIGRIGRLRWLTGRRSPEENWDAFEGVTGQPLVNLVQTRQSWDRVRYWLSDLAQEISPATKEGSLPSVLALDRVWITEDGRAKLLDFPAPGINGALDQGARNASKAGGEPPVTASRFLSEVAAAALANESVVAAKAPGEIAVPLPLHARDFLKRLPQFPDAETIRTTLKPLLLKLPVISRWRRAAVVAGCMAFPLISAAGMMLGVSQLQKWKEQNPGLMELSTLLQQRSAMQRFATSERLPDDRQFAIFIAHRYRPLITNEATWSSPVALTMVRGGARRFAEQSVAEHPAPTEEELAEAEAELKPYVQPAPFPDLAKHPGFPLLVMSATLVIYVAIPALLAALLFRGGLVLRIANITFVRRDGAPASRLRLFWRALVGWTPVVAAIFLYVGLHAIIGTSHPVLVQALAYSLVGVLAVLSAAMPGRGLHDRLAGTWPVPR